MKKGDRYKWTGFGADHDIRVTRVSQKGGWADIFVYDNRTLTSWTKRQRLPFPASFKRIDEKQLSELIEMLENPPPEFPLSLAEAEEMDRLKIGYLEADNA